jgi:subtilisin family serine protease
VRAHTSPFSGTGVKVAVQDSGLNMTHPDFAGCNITAQSFVPGQDVQDRHGIGTANVKTACGPLTPSAGRRYGVAYEADIFVGKVLSNQDSDSDASVLAGMNWAVEQQCAVISMSLGADVAQVHPPSWCG